MVSGGSKGNAFFGIALFASRCITMGGCKKTYSAPTFNLLANIWRFGIPTTNPPAVVVPCNIGPGQLTGTALATYSPGLGRFGGMWGCFPKGTDVQDAKNGIGPDSVELPAGTGRFYQAIWVDDIGLGYSNEHRFAELYPVPAWPTPFPSGAGPLPPSPPVAVWNNLGQATSAGIAVNTLAVGPFAAPPVGDIIVITMNAITPALGFPLANIGGAGIPFASGGLICGAVPNQCGVVHWLFVSPGGMITATINTGFIFYPIQMSVDTLTGGRITPGPPIIGQNPPLAPFLVMVTGLPNIQGLIAAFGEVAPIGLTTWAPPFAALGATIVDVVGAVAFSLNVGGMATAIPGANAASLPLQLPAAWSGVVDAIF